ncbi:MAG: hypothetical protein L0Y78_09125 [candidate division NC10 bacterium]|nr:hypothetical protein [candidate division NC10 bacterium]
MKRVSLVAMMVASLLLAWAIPALAGGQELLLQFVQFADSSLSDQDLAAVSGRGTQRAAGQAEAERVIIWDEGPAGAISSYHSLTGHGGIQDSRVSINGR